MSRFFTAALGVITVLGLAAGSTVVNADEVPEPVTGVWQKHEYRFQFMGFTTTYSCDGLADKLALLLKYAGARNDVKAYPSACASGYGRPDKLASASLTFYTLTAPTGHGDEKLVPAVWRPISVTEKTPRELGYGDCELVDQFRTNLLPMFAARHIDSHMTCVPHQISGSSIDLKFEALTLSPIPKK